MQEQLLLTAESKKIAEKTFRCDIVRSTMNGVLETGFATFGILVAIRIFDASESSKGILAAAMSAGLLLTPWVIKLASKSGLTATRFGSCLMVLSGIFTAGASLAANSASYTFCLVVGQLCASQLPGLMIQVYSRNYGPNERGRRISWNVMSSALVGMAISYWFGSSLDNSAENFRWIFSGMCLFALLSAATLLPIPSERIDEPEERKSSFGSGILLAWEDKLFGRMLLGWMVMGFGVLMTLPLRVEYLAGKGGLGMSNSEVAIVAVVSFSTARIVSSRIWGFLFDRLHFIGFRLILNFFLLSASVVFFQAESFAGVCIGSILAGFGTGGSIIAWSLWVTKLAPKGRETEYMGTHIAFTGIRGIVAPFLGYWVLSVVGFTGVAWTSAGLILTSSLIFASVLRNPRFRKD